MSPKLSNHRISVRRRINMSQRIKFSFPENVPKDKQISEKFIQGMLNRMAIGFYNYGPAQKNFPHNYDALKNVAIRVRKYRKTHNLEWLMDAANFLMLEFMYPRDRKAFYEATTKRDSPGSLLNNGKLSKGKEDFDSELSPALLARAKGLRTVPKPGEPGFKTVP
jgi:hypothetical protein